MNSGILPALANYIREEDTLIKKSPVVYKQVQQSALEIILTLLKNDKDGNIKAKYIYILKNERNNKLFNIKKIIKNYF